MPPLLPRSSVQVRPRMAVEIRPEGVYAASANDAVGQLAQVSSSTLPAGCIVPSLRAGNVVDRIALVAALRKAMSAVHMGKSRDVTLILPDTACRVLLLDFDEMPSNADEALSVVRFRLSRLLPFSPDAAQVSYQVMGRHAMVLQVLAVAIPQEVLSEYESAVRDAGYEPGVVLPSTLAVAAALEDVGNTASLLVNGSESWATTAIVRRGELLLHRTLEFRPAPMEEAAAAVAQEPANRAVDERWSRALPAYPGEPAEASEIAVAEVVAAGALLAHDEQQFEAELLQAINVAAAYYEDSLGVAPESVMMAGTLSRKELEPSLAEIGLAVSPVLQAVDLLCTTAVPRGLLAGLRGALKS